MRMISRRNLTTITTTVTERARKLRAQYNLQAQGLRTRIEIRVNRIPMALRKLKMGDLLQKHSTNQQKPVATKQTTAAARAPPPVPEKDFNPARSVVSRAESPRAVNRPLKRLRYVFWLYRVCCMSVILILTSYPQ